MVITRLTRVYAKSLMDLAQEQKKTEEILKDMLLIEGTLQETKDLILFLKSPLIKSDKKKAALKEVFGSSISEISVLFINLLINHRRESQLAEVIFAFKALYNKLNGIVEAEVTTAYELSKKEGEAIKEKLEAALEKKIELNNKVDTNVLGGMSLRFGDQQYDGTLATKLRELKKGFKKNQYVANF